MKKEFEPSPEVSKNSLGSQEFQIMRNLVNRDKINPNNPDSRTTLTPAEHKLFGSTMPGLGFHPNCPLAEVVGSSLEKINQGRAKESRESQARESWTMMEIEDGVFIQLLLKFLPLNQEQIESEDPAPTFEVIRARNKSGDEIEVSKEIKQKAEGMIRRDQEQTKQNLKNKNFLGWLRQ